MLDADLLSGVQPSPGRPARDDRSRDQPGGSPRAPGSRSGAVSSAGPRPVRRQRQNRSTCSAAWRSWSERARAKSSATCTGALAYGWWSPLDVDGTPWTTLEPSATSSTRRRHGRVRQVAPLPDAHVSTRRGLSLTSPARTAADCLRHLSAEDAVPIADCAIARGASVEQIAKIIAWQARLALRRARSYVSGLVDGRRESWLESRSAVAFRRAWPDATDAAGHDPRRTPALRRASRLPLAEPRRRG